MIPCKKCTPKNEDGEYDLNRIGRDLKGAKQVGKAIYKKIPNGNYIRRYRCHDCGYEWEETGNVYTGISKNAPILKIIDSGIN